MLALTVAKKSADRKRPGPVPDPENSRSSQIIVRCKPAWKDWVGRYADSKGLSVSDAFDEAILKMARTDGFEMPPER